MTCLQNFQFPFSNLRISRLTSNWRLEIGDWKLRRGYTLIEILVGLTIIGILFSVGFVSFRDFSRRQALSGTGKNLQGDLRLAQEMAIAGQKPDAAVCAGPSYTITGIYFRVLSDQNYVLEALCTGSVNTVEIKNVTLPTDISMTPPVPNPILFKVLGSGTNIDEGAEGVVTLSQVGTTNTMTVTVTAGGEIK